MIDSPTIFLCPNCFGQKTVSKPPHIPGDIHEWSGTGAELYPCPTCEGRGYIMWKEQTDEAK